MNEEMQDENEEVQAKEEEMQVKEEMQDKKDDDLSMNILNYRMKHKKRKVRRFDVPLGTEPKMIEVNGFQIKCTRCGGVYFQVLEDELFAKELGASSLNKVLRCIRCDSYWTFEFVEQNMEDFKIAH